jgi:hypothetical protein
VDDRNGLIFLPAGLGSGSFHLGRDFDLDSVKGPLALRLASISKAPLMKIRFIYVEAIEVLGIAQQKTAALSLM